MFPQKVDLVYSGFISENKYNFLCVNGEFMRTLDQQGQIAIQGEVDEDAKFFGQSKSFQLVNVKYLNMLLVDSKGQILREGNNFLKVEIRQPQTHEIYDILRQKQLNYASILNQNIKKLIHEKGSRLQDLCKTFKISPKEFQSFAARANYVRYEDSYLIVSTKAYNSIFHAVFTHLTSKSLSLQNINLDSIYSSVYPENEVDKLIFERGCQLYLQRNQQGTYRVTMPNVTRYILSELGELKQEYLKSQFDGVFKQMLALYTPVNMKIPEEFPEISEYFLYIKEHDEMYYYSKMSLPTTVKELINYITRIKKKFTYAEIKGVMGHIFPDKSLQEALIKHFRKFGEQYQLKSLILA